MAEREWFDTDYYAVLGVSSTATDQEITRAYRSLAKKNHPDTNPGKEETFKKISAAYDVLGDAAKRKEYDEVRRLGPAAAGFGGGAPGGFNGADLGDFGDIFSGLFGGRRQRAQRGADLETSLHLSFRDAVTGIETQVHLPSETPCGTCRATGAAPGSSVTTCERCQGRGVLNDDQGPFSLSSVCPQCNGRGGRVERPCASCHGSGRELSQRRVKVRIPAGVDDAQRIVLKGKGAPGTHGGPAGNLFVNVHVAPDLTFARKGRHLTTTVRVSFPDAALGTTVEVPTFDEPVSVKVAPGTQSGTTMRVRGRGVPAAGKHPLGDLLVTVQVDVPRELSGEQRRLIEKLRKTLAEGGDE
jgi:molecular chaperone DnaJ